MIYKVIENVKHNGDVFAKGSFTSAEDGAFAQLVADGIFAIIPGVDTIEEAKALDAEQTEEQEVEKPAPEQNTWEAKPDAEADAPTEEVVTPPTQTDDKSEENKTSFFGKMFGGKDSKDGSVAEEPVDTVETSTEENKEADATKEDDLDGANL